MTSLVSITPMEIRLLTIPSFGWPKIFRYAIPLVDGQGNFGSIDGDAAAAMRYTEIRMAKISHDLLSDLDKETVDFSPNYDGTESIPDVLPTRIPNLLVNGSSGIAVGMATNIPPHNLNEVINAAIALLDNPDAEIDDLMEHIQGPDFPTELLLMAAGIIKAYKEGRGKSTSERKLKCYLTKLLVGKRSLFQRYLTS